jgi:hypothetical protein
MYNLDEDIRAMFTAQPNLRIGILKNSKAVLWNRKPQLYFLAEPEP